MRHVIFGLVASGLTVYNPMGDPKLLLTLFTISMGLMSFYLSYRMGYLQGKKELLDKMNEVIELINEANEVKLRLDAAFEDIKPLKIIQKEE